MGLDTLKNLSKIPTRVLMLEDIPVLAFNLMLGSFTVYREELVPYSIREMDNLYYPDKSAEYISRVRDWLLRRMFPIERDNSKILSMLAGVAQSVTSSSKLRFVLATYAVSLIDSYWVKTESENITYAKVSLYNTGRFNISPYTLLGEIPTLEVVKSLLTNNSHPDFSTDGMFPKSWVYENGEWFLYKTDKTTDKINTISEVEAYNIAKCFTGLQVAEYELVDLNGTLCSKCKCIHKDGYSVIHCSELYEFCSNNGLEYEDTVNLLFDKSLANMIVYDYLVFNTDRHIDNYSFFMNNETGNIEGLTPMYDLNQALVALKFEKKDDDVLTQIFCSRDTMKEVLLRYKGKATLKYNGGVLSDNETLNNQLLEVINELQL